ncbi:hypothetical protein Q4Q35_21425 [Flavivirga aquimarina]|uniref:Uncharacterized protein n=1 Tax=Flavivirga aquimarina TaxID=2027862 RepID=A0ABT8WGV3_9FLAO|nr:hypothetical protein [Flavivirga aquimarina]MDO5972370.1 hypothetical protein [Flavivirga aquimarina]
MLISRILFNNQIYFTIHAEQSVSWALINEPGTGVFEETLFKDTLERILSEGDLNKDFDTILDFDNILICQNNLYELIKEIKNNSKSLTLLNVNVSTIKKLNLSIFNNTNNTRIDRIYTSFFVSEENKIEYEIISDIFKNEFIEYLKLNSKNSTKENSLIFHHSSSIYLNKYIDVKSMITNKKEFFLLALYHLALKTKKHWKNLINSPNRPILVCQNLNSAYITSIMSSYLGFDILILDKIGPINELYSNLDNKIEEGQNYLVVSDVVCLGTEIKITKNLINYLGGNYIGNISVVRIQTAHPTSKVYDDVESVFEITKEDNPINYQIITSLDDKFLNEKNNE